MNRIIMLMTLLFLTFQVFGQDYKYVNTETLNVRENAGKQYNVIGQINMRDKVIVISKIESWTKIETEIGVKGYVATKYLISTNDQEKSKDKKDFSWFSAFIYLSILAYVGYKFISLFSGLLGGSSSNKSSSLTTNEKTLKWYHCGVCGTLVKLNNTPYNTNRSCLNKDFHKWEELGKIGNLNYQCNICGTVIQTTATPKNNTNWSCLGNNYHKWTKL